MKKIKFLNFVMIISLFHFGCSNSEADQYQLLGEWANTKQNDNYILIYKEKNNYIIKVDPNSRRTGDEETYVGIASKGSRLELDNGSFLTFSETENKIIMGGQSFLLLRQIKKEDPKEFYIGPQIEKIREVYAAVTSFKYRKRRKKRDCMEYIVTTSDLVNMAKKSIYGGHGGTSSEYYYEGGELVFVYIVSVWDAGVSMNTTSRSEQRLYFVDEQPIKYKLDDEFMPLENLPAWEENAKEFVEYFTNPGKYPNMCSL